MNNEIKTLINNLTQDIIDFYNIQTPIYNIEDVIKVLGGYIEKNPTIDYTFNSCIKKQDNTFIIYISSFQTIERKKFIIAHELGHLFLHMGYKISPNLWNKQKDRTCFKTNNLLMDFQANEFAAALLMPKTLYKNIMDQYTIENQIKITQIANYFKVPISAAFSRGEFLGYFQ